MLKHRQEQIQIIVRLTDVAICIVSFGAAYWFRTSPRVLGPADIGTLESLSWLLACSLTLHLLLYPYLRFYESIRLKTYSELVLMILKSFIVEFFILGSLVFLFQAKDTSRTFFGLFLFVNYVLILSEKVGGKILLTSIRRRGYNYKQVLVVGTGNNARRVIATLQRNKHWGYIPFGMLKTSGDDPGINEIDGVKVLGTVQNLLEVTKDRTVDEVYFAADRLDVNEISNEVYLCEKLGIPARFSLGLFDLPNSKVTYSLLDNLPVVTYYTTLMTPADAFLKRAMDIMIALVGLMITVVLYPWIAFKIKRESPGPIIFKQLRVGENGRRFKCYKFRTMRVDAEARKAELLSGNEMEGPIFKIGNDPRVTPFGSFLRRTSLDELPQFFNILRGDMSVVGTRPPTPDEVNQYQTHFKRRLSIRPGLTGLWQVSGRSQIRKFEDILALDLQYIDRWSIWLDVQIIFKTIWVTLFRRGAA